MTSVMTDYIHVSDGGEVSFIPGEMTDNRTTELREKLDELGIEHFDYDKGGRTQTQWEAPDGLRHFTYETAANPAKTARLVIGWFPTPEQAIAATLGSEREKALEELVRDMYEQWAYSIDGYYRGLLANYRKRMAELGLEVGQ